MSDPPEEAASKASTLAARDAGRLARVRASDLQTLSDALDEADGKLASVLKKVEEKRYHLADGRFLDPGVLAEVAADRVKIQMAQLERDHAFSRFMMAMDARRQRADRCIQILLVLFTLALTVATIVSLFTHHPG